MIYYVDVVDDDDDDDVDVADGGKKMNKEKRYSPLHHYPIFLLNYFPSHHFHLS